MRFGIYFFLLMLPAFSFAQNRPVNIKIYPRNYYQYEWTREWSHCEGSGEEDTSATRCTWYTAYRYPWFITSDAAFSKLINTSVRVHFGDTASSSSYIRLPSWKCIEDKPGANLMNYIINYQDKNFVSFTLFMDFEPSGMGNGFRHDAIPTTFDLVKKKKLTLGDIIRDECDTLVYRVVISELKKSDPGFFAETGEINNPFLFQPFSTLGSSFSLTPLGINLYYQLSYGGKISYSEIKLGFTAYGEWFDDPGITGLFRPAKRD